MSASQPHTSRIAIIGGGVSGLAAAHKLSEISSRDGISIDYRLFEADDKTGGILRTVHRDGFLLEAGPDSFISEKPEALQLASRIGLSDRIIQTNSADRRSFIVRRGKLIPVPEGFHLLAPSRLWPFITSPIFSWTGKARMALDLLIPRNSNDDESLASFVRRRLGNEALARMAQPMVGGIYTADPEKLSLAATMPRFLDMERDHGSVIRAMLAGRRKAKDQSEGVSGPRYSLFLSFDDGMQILTDRLAELIGKERIQTQTRVDSVRPSEKNGWMIATSAGKTWLADAVVLALPAYAAAKVIAECDDVLASELKAIPYASTATINVAFRRSDVKHPLNGFGFVVPLAENRKILACTFSSIKFAGRAPSDTVLLRAFAGGALQPEVFELDEPVLVATVLDELKELLGVVGAPLLTHVEKWPNSMAQYHVGHLDRVGRIKERVAKLPGLQLAGNAYRGAGIPDCIRSGEHAAESALRYVLESAGRV